MRHRGQSGGGCVEASILLYFIIVIRPSLLGKRVILLTSVLSFRIASTVSTIVRGNTENHRMVHPVACSLSSVRPFHTEALHLTSSSCYRSGHGGGVLCYHVVLYTNSCHKQITHQMTHRDHAPNCHTGVTHQFATHAMDDASVCST